MNTSLDPRTPCCGAIRAVPWTSIWIAVGLALRLFHYLGNPSLWHDEAAVVVNVLHKSFDELWRTLLYSEAAPPLFLWMEKAVVLLLGDSLFAFRLIPFLASCAAFIGIIAGARRVLAANAVPWVAMVAACSDTILWHSCEAKPYAVDLLVSTGVLGLIVYGRAWPIHHQLILATLAAPFCIFVSYPACFVFGGFALCLLPAALRERRIGTCLAYGAMGASLSLSFLALLFGPIHAQRNERMLSCWVHAFPNWTQPWTVPGWLLMRSTEVVRYAYEPIGNVLFGAVLAGAIVLWRQGQRRLVTFLIAPIGLAAVAGLTSQYPYGPFRVMTFAAPACWLLLGAGIPAILHGLRRFGSLVPVSVALLVCFPVAQAGYRVMVPWRRAETGPAAAYINARIQPDEPLIGNAWEDAYYFRDGKVTYLSCGELQALPFDRVWVMATTADPGQRAEMLSHIWQWGPWRVLQTKGFVRVTVYHLERIHAGPLP